MSNGEWVVCPLKEAEGFRFKGKVYSFALFTAAINRFAPRELDPIISLRVEVDRWVKVASSDFDVFGIEPVKLVKPEPMEWVGHTLLIESEVREDNGYQYSVATYGVTLGPDWKGKKVKVIEVLE